jgi:hypothetical protein
VHGQFQSTFTKLSTLHAKNNFSLAIITGNLFAEDDNDAVSDLLAGKFTIPLSTYFTVGSTALPQRVVDKLATDEDVCDPRSIFCNTLSCWFIILTFD